ncbi:MAG TPA: tryptophan halogenase family protein [Steroidobacteraceae bacterium]|nr:tryptophan halogenase family protein [Steroidobacteraceae bacterium]
MNLSVKKVVVAGGGTIGYIAAAALRRTFRHADLEVVVVDTPERGAPAARWTLPSQRGAHAQIGLSEADFLRETDATYRLASELSGWQRPASFLLAHAEIGSPIEVTPFYKLLLASELRGNPENAEMYSVGAGAARLGRFARPMGSGNELTAGFTYGYHLDERAYARLLRTLSAKAGVQSIAGRIADVGLRENGHVDSLVLDGGQQVAGDLFVDCTGAAAAIFSRLDAGPRVDWARWLPCDRIVSALIPTVGDPPALTRLLGTEAGWVFHAPLATKAFVGHVYSSAHMNDETALATLCNAVRVPSVEPEVTSFAAGRRERSWVGNCIALGAAAMEIEPLAGANLHFAQIGLAKLLELFPIGGRDAGESFEFNRIVGEYADSLRDFTLATYRLSPRPGPFWDATRAADLPASLSTKLDLYAASGRIDTRDHEIFEEHDWAWLFLGSGFRPRALEWQVARAVSGVKREQVNQLRDQVGRLVTSMPRHMEYLQRVKTTPPRAPGANA